MINHGLALFKPGESDLGTAMRLWIVNRHCWKHSSSSINDRIAVKNATQDPLFSNLYSSSSEGIQSLKCSHAKILGYDSPLETSSWPMFPAVKNSISHKQCFSCAKLGHHSVLFDLPWIKKCPIHDEPLSKQCPVCNRNWPTISNLSIRSCEVCGARLSLEKLISEDAFNSELFAEKIPCLVNFFSMDISLYQAQRKYFLDFPAIRNDAQSLLNAIPSLITSFSNDSSMTEWLETLGVIITKCHMKRFELTPIINQDAVKPDIELMERCRSRILNLANKTLAKQAKHKLGTCQKDELYGHFNCSYCETWKQLNDGFRKSLVFREDRIMMRYIPPYTREINVTDPGLIMSLYDLETDRYFEIPRNIQALIYCIEIWQCITRMFSQVGFFLNTPPTLESQKTNISEGYESYLDHRKHHFTPFYFVKKEIDCLLFFPNVFKARKLDQAFTQIKPFTEE